MITTTPALLMSFELGELFGTIWGIVIALLGLVLAIMWTVLPFSIYRIEALLKKSDRASQDQEMRLMLHQQRLEENQKAQLRLLQQLNDSLSGAKVDVVEE